MSVELFEFIKLSKWEKQLPNVFKRLTNDPENCAEIVRFKVSIDDISSFGDGSIFCRARFDFRKVENYSID